MCKKVEIKNVLRLFLYGGISRFSLETSHHTGIFPQLFENCLREANSEKKEGLT
jgi:hypothetical protein